MRRRGCEERGRRGLAVELPEAELGGPPPRATSPARYSYARPRAWLASLGHAIAHSGLSRAGLVARGGTKHSSACGSSVPKPQRPASSSRDSASGSDMLASCATRPFRCVSTRTRRRARHGCGSNFRRERRPLRLVSLERSDVRRWTRAHGRRVDDEGAVITWFLPGGDSSAREAHRSEDSGAGLRALDALT